MLPLSAASHLISFAFRIAGLLQGTFAYLLLALVLLPVHAKLSPDIDATVDIKDSVYGKSKDTALQVIACAFRPARTHHVSSFSSLMPLCRF